MSSELDLLKLAFKKGLLDDIARADLATTPAEQALIDRLCPPAALRAAGFVDEHGQLTAWFHTRRVEARERLPNELRTLHRLDLVTELLELCIVDGQLHRDEGVPAAAGRARARHRRPHPQRPPRHAPRARGPGGPRRPRVIPPTPPPRPSTVGNLTFGES
jgi:hypothetical protein